MASGGAGCLFEAEEGRRERSLSRGVCVFFQAEDGIRDRSPSRGLGDVYKRQGVSLSCVAGHGRTTFPTVAPRSLHESLSPDWKSHGVQPLMAHCKHKRI